MATHRMPIIQFLKRHLPWYKSVTKERLWEELQERRRKGDFRLLVPVSGEKHRGEKIKLGPKQGQLRFFGFVEIVVAEAERPRASSKHGGDPLLETTVRLPFPRYETTGVSRDEFFLAHLELEARARYKEIEPRYRNQPDGRHLLAEATQLFVDQRIADHLGKAAPSRRPTAGAQQALSEPKYVGRSRTGKLMVECPVCDVQLVEARLQQHLLEVHGKRVKHQPPRRSKRRRSGASKRRKQPGRGRLWIVQGGAPGLGKR